jgi:hypothetical protein
MCTCHFQDSLLADAAQWSTGSGEPEKKTNVKCAKLKQTNRKSIFIIL